MPVPPKAPIQAAEGCCSAGQAPGVGDPIGAIGVSAWVPAGKGPRIAGADGERAAHVVADCFSAGQAPGVSDLISAIRVSAWVTDREGP